MKNLFDKRPIHQAITLLLGLVVSFSVRAAVPPEIVDPTGEHWILDAGDSRNGLAHGKGKAHSQSCYLYEGGFRNGMFHGQGILLFESGGFYQGGFRKGLFHGKGALFHENGVWFLGHFKKGRKHGRGQVYWPDGVTYKGRWKDGCRVAKSGQWRFQHVSYLTPLSIFSHATGLEAQKRLFAAKLAYQRVIKTTSSRELTVKARTAFQKLRNEKPGADRWEIGPSSGCIRNLLQVTKTPLALALASAMPSALEPSIHTCHTNWGKLTELPLDPNTLRIRSKVASTRSVGSIPNHLKLDAKMPVVSPCGQGILHLVHDKNKVFSTTTGHVWERRRMETNDAPINKALQMDAWSNKVLYITISDGTRTRLEWPRLKDPDCPVDFTAGRILRSSGAPAKYIPTRQPAQCKGVQVIGVGQYVAFLWIDRQTEAKNNLSGLVYDNGLQRWRQFPSFQCNLLRNKIHVDHQGGRLVIEDCNADHDNRGLLAFTSVIVDLRVPRVRRASTKFELRQDYYESRWTGHTLFKVGNSYISSLGGDACQLDTNTGKWRKLPPAPRADAHFIYDSNNIISLRKHIVLNKMSKTYLGKEFALLTFYDPARGEWCPAIVPQGASFFSQRQLDPGVANKESWYSEVYSAGRNLCLWGLAERKYYKGQKCCPSPEPTTRTKSTGFCLSW